MKIIIDTDPGVDDAMAIFYAHAASDIELLGLTTIFGNVYVEQAARNAVYLTDMLGLNIPVAKGAGQPYAITDFEPAANVHGPEGFGDVTDIQITRAPIVENAAEFLVRMAREHKGELVVSAVGPLTNIADALRLDPEFKTNVAKIVIMGGAVDCPGNITQYAEANIFHDPHAAAEVLASGAEIVLVGLDVTLQTLCDLNDFQIMQAQAPKTGGFLHEIGKFYLNFYREVADKDGCGLHDSTALMACTHPHLFKMEKTGIHVALEGPKIGQTIRDNTAPSITVCTQIEAQKIKDLFMQTICSNP